VSAAAVTLQVDSPQRMRSVAAELAAGLAPGDWVALTGELGAGKTCFVRGLAQGLGLRDDQVASPTFVLLHLYDEPRDPSQTPRAQLAHLDAYRLGGAEELAGLGLDALLDSRPVVVTVEWAERIDEAVPPGALWAHLEHAEDPGARRLTLRSEAPSMGALLEALAQRQPPLGDS